MAISTEESTPIPVFFGAYFIPYLIAYLVHLPNTRAWRIALLPIGWACMVCLIRTINVQGEPLYALPMVETAMKFNLGGARLYAFMESPPTYPALPVNPPLWFIRKTTPFRAFNLLFDCNRHIDTNPIRTPHQPYLFAVVYHLSMTVLYNLLTDLSSFAPYHLIGLDHPVLGLHQPLGWILWTISAGCTMYHGSVMIWYATAFLSIVSGLFTGEEWPTAFNNPLISTSMSEFWGKRYHQFERTIFSFWATPFAWISRPAQIIGVFFVSAMYHMVFYRPFTKSLEPLPHFTFWLGCGLVVVLERAYHKHTGRKVQGWKGRVWLWCWFMLIARVQILYEVETGWFCRGRALAIRDPQNSPLNWVLLSLGIPGPLDWFKPKA